MSEHAEERPWTVREVASYLSRSEEVVRRYARSGRLQGVKDLGGGWRFDPADVRALLGGVRAATDRAKAIEAHVAASLARFDRRKGG